MSCWLWSCLLLQVNFVQVGCWLAFIMISITLEFNLKFQRFPHLLRGECEAAYVAAVASKRLGSRERVTIQPPSLVLPIDHDGWAESHNYQPALIWLWQSFSLFLTVYLCSSVCAGVLVSCWCPNLLSTM